MRFLLRIYVFANCPRNQTALIKYHVVLFNVIECHEVWIFILFEVKDVCYKDVEKIQVY